jgi:hypothetical protein
MSVRPDGGVTFTYVLAEGFGGIGPPPDAIIKYVHCTPAAGGAPRKPSCSPPVLVHQETRNHNILPLQSPNHVGSLILPVHANRRDANGIETYVVWERCKVTPSCNGGECPCFDADVVMKASDNDGATWFPAEPASVAIGRGDQFLPAIATDGSRDLVNIVYYSTANDAVFHRRTRVILRQIAPGGATPDPVAGTHIVTRRLNDQGSYSFFDRPDIGVAARGTGVEGKSRLYVHHVSSNIQGIYSGVSFPDRNNHLSRVDY